MKSLLRMHYFVLLRRPVIHETENRCLLHFACVLNQLSTIQLHNCQENYQNKLNCFKKRIFPVSFNKCFDLLY